MSSTGAAARSLISTTIAAGMRPRAAASARARKLDPRPEASTPTRSGSDIVHARIARHDLAHRVHALARRLQAPGRGGRVVGRDHQEEAQTHVERAPHLRVVHLSLIHISEPTRLLSISYA